MTAAEHKAAEARIHRLAQAIGSGPHSFGFSLVDHVRKVLEAIGDTAALSLLEAV